MALAVASGCRRNRGYTRPLLPGFVVPLFGGSRTQVTGPTAAFVVILSPIAPVWASGTIDRGVYGGVLLVVMGLARMGQVIEFVPYPVTTGFTAGIALVIGTLQMKDFFGPSSPAPSRPLHRARESPLGGAGHGVHYGNVRGTYDPFSPDPLAKNFSAGSGSLGGAGHCHGGGGHGPTRLAGFGRGHHSNPISVGHGRRDPGGTAAVPVALELGGSGRRFARHFNSLH
jgi:hypothetical protein